MLTTQFIGLNLYFAVNLLAALVCFGVFWLIYDAWLGRHPRREILKWAGFLALSVGFLLRATAIQVSTGGLSQLADAAAEILRIAGYCSIVLGQIIDPLQPRPKYAGDTMENMLGTSEEAPIKAKTTRPHHGFLLAPITGLLLPALAALGGLLYFRRATTGLERHLLPVAWGFAGLTAFELLNDTAAFQNTTNPTIYQWVSPYGPIWWAALLALTVASFVLGRWVWAYLTKRLQSQLFMILVTQALGLFLFTTIGFTFLLLKSGQDSSLADLATASHVLDYAIASRQAETAAQAEAVASIGGVAPAIAARDTKALATATGDYLARHGLTSLVVVDGSGQVLLRGEDPERFGDSRSGDPLVRRALVGTAASSVVVSEGVAAPTVTLVAASPIRDGAGNIIGAAIAGRAITGAFVDGIRSSTGLDSAVYGHAVRAATTLVGPNGTDRAIGVAEATTAVTDRVLEHGKSYSGTVNFQNRPYLAGFSPLKDVNNVPVGMLLAARPASALYASAYRSIQITFFFVVILVVVSIYPIFLLSRYLARQLK